MPAPKKILLPVLLIVAGAVGFGSWYAMKLARREDGVIRVSGNLECIEVSVGFKIAGRVQERPVDEGFDVTRDKTLIARLETADLEADLALRRAELRAAEAAFSELEAGSRVEEVNAARSAMEKAWAQLAELEAGSRPQEIDTAWAQLQAAAVEKNRLALELGRARRLFRQNTITQEQFDQATAAHDVAAERYNQAQQQYKLVKEGPRQQQIDQARAAYFQMRSQYWLVEDGPRPEAIQQARAKVEQARASLRLSETRLGYAIVNSPLSGVVLSKNIEEGEYVSPGTPVVTVADLDNVWLRAYVDEGDLARIRLNQPAEVTTDAYRTTYLGKITFISSEAEFTPKQVQTEKERTRLVYRIKIDIDNRDHQLKPGMPADARILPADRAPPDSRKTPVSGP